MNEHGTETCMRSTESSTEMLSNAAEVVVQRAAVQPRHAQPSVRASASVAGQQSRLLRYGGGYMRTYLACINRYAQVPWMG